MSYPPLGHPQPDGSGNEPEAYPPTGSGWGGYGQYPALGAGYPGPGGPGYPGSGYPPVGSGGSDYQPVGPGGFGPPGPPPVPGLQPPDAPSGGGGGGGGAVRWLAIISAVVLAVVLVAGLGWWGMHRSARTESAQETTTANEAPTVSHPNVTTPPRRTQPSTEPAPADCAGVPRQPGPATPADWQPVAAASRMGYDVPPNWSVLSCSTLVGWEKPCPDGPFGTCVVRAMKGAAELAEPACEHGSRATSGLAGNADTTDLNAALDSESKLVADIYTSKSGHVPTVALGPVRELKVGDTPALQMVATVTDIEAGACTAPSALHSMVVTTAPGQRGTVVFLISMEQDYPGAPDPGLIDQMVGTLRLIP